MRWFSPVLALALGALLSGCFASDQPLFSSESAVLALGAGGRYATYETVGGKEEKSDPVEVRPGPGNVYEFINEKGAVTPATFHQLSGEEHIAQVKLEGASGYGYILVRIKDREVIPVLAECNKQDAAKMAALGVVRRNDYECRIDKVADPVAFFTGLKRSEQRARMVRE